MLKGKYPTKFSADQTLFVRHGNMTKPYLLLNFMPLWSISLRNSVTVRNESVDSVTAWGYLSKLCLRMWDLHAVFRTTEETWQYVSRHTLRYKEGKIIQRNLGIWSNQGWSSAKSRLQ